MAAYVDVEADVYATVNAPAPDADNDDVFADAHEYRPRPQVLNRMTHFEMPESYKVS